MISSEGSFAHMLSQLKKGDESAIRTLWDRFFEPLQRLAIERVNVRDRKIRDEEDLALSAINAFQECLKNGRYSSIENTNDVWHLLVKIVENKAIDHVRRERAVKRGAGNVRGDSYLNGMGYFAEIDMNHEERIDFLDHLRTNLLKLEDAAVQEVVFRKIEGFSNKEIAAKIGKSVSSVERKLRLARQIWIDSNR